MNANDKMDELKTIDLSDTVSQAEYDSLKDSYLRLAADFDNYRKNVEVSRAKVEATAAFDTIYGLLPIVDDICRAIDASSDSEGFSLIYNNLQVYLRKMGVTNFGNEGEKFDSEMHEALMVTKDKEVESGHISKVIRQGYSMYVPELGETYIIRHAHVAVEE